MPATVTYFCIKIDHFCTNYIQFDYDPQLRFANTVQDKWEQVCFALKTEEY
jgi:hypothetical protein